DFLEPSGPMRAFQLFVRQDASPLVSPFGEPQLATRRNPPQSDGSGAIDPHGEIGSRRNGSFGDIEPIDVFRFDLDSRILVSLALGAERAELVGMDLP